MYLNWKRVLTLFKYKDKVFHHIFAFIDHFHDRFQYKFQVPPLENLGLGHEMFHDETWPDLSA